MVEGAPSGERPRRTSAELEAAAEAAIPPLLRDLAGDPLSRHPQAPRRDFRDHSSPDEAMPRSGFLHTRSLTVFAWEHMTGFVLDLLRMLRIVASFGCVGALEELVENRQCALTVWVCDVAPGKGQLGALTWLHSRGCPWDRYTSYTSAYCGQLEALRYAHEHGCPRDTSTCYNAAFYGHLEVLRYAHEHGCSWDSFTSYGAVHLEVLRWRVAA
ncbi:hypothetical protein T492DRAFT_870841 [Pavlovales sp. CCMP2436]|nr:hypothetical protein T492DRAFT_870841 [Pavlovales sp. CCMP2436]